MLGIALPMNRRTNLVSTGYTRTHAREGTLLVASGLPNPAGQSHYIWMWKEAGAAH
jgi:hypothetical protein